MFRAELLLVLYQTLGTFCFSSDIYFYTPYNVTRSTLSGIAEYRSALTLDWLAAEDSRQRELVSAYETEPPAPSRVLASECMSYAKPASGKVARLMLELLKNLEGDDGTLITDLIQALIRSKLLVETSMLDAEPNLEALVKTPGVMMGEPHSTFPRILAMVWMAAGDTTTTKKHGWCPIKKITKYLSISKPVEIAKHMRSLDPVIARARYIMEEFIQHITPINVFSDKQHFEFGKKVKAPKYSEPLSNKGREVKRPTRTPSMVKPPKYEPHENKWREVKRSTRTPSMMKMPDKVLNSVSKTQLEYTATEKLEEPTSSALYSDISFCLMISIIMLFVY